MWRQGAGGYWGATGCRRTIALLHTNVHEVRLSFLNFLLLLGLNRRERICRGEPRLSDKARRRTPQTAWLCARACLTLASGVTQCIEIHATGPAWPPTRASGGEVSAIATRLQRDGRHWRTWWQRADTTGLTKYRTGMGTRGGHLELEPLRSPVSL